MALSLPLGKPAEQLADYFDACRRKRSEIDYTGATMATTTEAEELLLHAEAFLDLVERWIDATHPALSPCCCFYWLDTDLVLGKNGLRWALVNG
jgi:hypothetical protein